MNDEIEESSGSRGLPRSAEIAIAAVALVVATPLLAFSALAILIVDGAPILYRQDRVGRGGRIFSLYKLRSMRPSDSGPEVTVSNDPRITSPGRLLRRLKLDELPQLWNVLIGDMALVGPRPEVPKYVNRSDPAWRAILAVRPGLTDPVTLELRNEERILARMAGDPVRNYMERLLPLKLERSAAYLSRRTWWTDIEVLCKTSAAFLGAGRPPSPPLIP